MTPFPLTPSPPAPTMQCNPESIIKKKVKKNERCSLQAKWRRCRLLEVREGALEELSASGSGGDAIVGQLDGCTAASGLPDVEIEGGPHEKVFHSLGVGLELGVLAERIGNQAADI